MVFNNAKKIMLGSLLISRVYVGGTMVYPFERKFLELNPKNLWLTEENDYTELVEVISNTRWKIDIDEK